MNLDYQYLLDGSFQPDSKLWIYQCNRLFSLSEALAVEDKLNAFTASWKSHGAPVKGAGYLFFGQFIVLMADESATAVGGCSTDSSVAVIRDIQQTFNVHLFERTSLAFVVKDKIELLPMSQIQYAIDNGFINGDTLYFNNTVLNKKEFETNWIIPVKDSWLAKKVKFSTTIS